MGSKRNYEASSCGSIPIIQGNIEKLKFTFKHLNNPPWILCDTWEDGLIEAKKLLNNPNELLNKQKQIIEWWNNYIICLKEKIISIL